MLGAGAAGAGAGSGAAGAAGSGVEAGGGGVGAGAGAATDVAVVAALVAASTTPLETAVAGVETSGVLGRAICASPLAGQHNRTIRAARTTGVMRRNSRPIAFPDPIRARIKLVIGPSHRPPWRDPPRLLSETGYPRDRQVQTRQVRTTTSPSTRWDCRWRQCVAGCHGLGDTSADDVRRFRGPAGVAAVEESGPVVLHGLGDGASGRVVGDVVAGDFAVAERAEEQWDVDRVECAELRVGRGVVDAEQVDAAARRSRGRVPSAASAPRRGRA